MTLAQPAQPAQPAQSSQPAQPGPASAPGGSTSATAAASAAPSDAASTDRFDRADWASAFRNVGVELTDVPLQPVRGSLPAALVGTLYRNGPGRLERGGHWVHHPFDGDGMITALRFEAGGLSLTNRFVRTEGWLAEEKVGKPRVALVVDERRAVDAAGVKARGTRNRDGCGRVPLVLASVVDVDVGFAEDDGHRLCAGRTEPNRITVDCVGNEDRRIRCAVA